MIERFIGELIEGETYEYFDNRVAYIERLHEHHAVVYEKARDIPGCQWTWQLRTTKYLRRNIRTYLDMED